jgi:hypothetical protein
MNNSQKELIFGTSDDLSYTTLDYVLKKKIKIHTSFEYKSFVKLAKLYRKKKYQNKIILKLKDTEPKELIKKLNKFFFLFNTEQLFAVQLSGNAIYSQKFDQMYLVIENYIKDKRITKIYLENYWEYSKTNIKNLKKYNLDGIVLPYNLIEREIDSNSLKYLRSNKIEIISLRIFAGNGLHKSSKTFLNTLFTKYFLICLILKLYSIVLNEKNLIKLYLDYFFANENINSGVFFSSKIKNIKKNINYKNNNLINKKILNFDYFFKGFIYMFNGLNSMSSVKHKMSIFYRIEIFIFRNFLKILKNSKIYLNLIYSLFLHKNICYIASASQYLNLTELLKKKKIEKCLLIFGKRPKKRFFKNFIEKYNLTNTRINTIDLIDVNERLSSIIIYIISFIKKFEYLICGNHLNLELNKIFLLNSKYKYYLDDGTATLKKNTLTLSKNIFAKKLIKKKIIDKIINFTCYDIPKSEKNNFLFLKNFFNDYEKQTIDDGSIIFLGTGFIDKKIWTPKQYFKFLRRLNKLYSNFKISYFPHPVEHKDIMIRDMCLKLGINFLDYDGLIETFILSQKKIPKKIVSIYSSALINLSIVKPNNIELINLVLDNILSYKKNDVDFSNYEEYFNKNKNIKNIYLSI